MIYTLTVNPSLDYIVDVENFKTGEVNRTKAEKIFPGGKGINVSIVLQNLGIKNKALGFTAGFTGTQIETLLAQKHVDCDFIRLENGFSRINVKLRSEQESEINGQGPSIEEKDVESLFSKLELLKTDDILVLAGSIPKTLPQSFYSDIMARLEAKGVRFVVDATRDLLKKSLKYKPFLVKPNNHELGELFGVKLNARDEVIPYALKLKEMGAQNVLVSMAEKGAVLAAADGKIYQGKASECKLVNSVGAGDSMVAGFIAGYINSSSYSKALVMGLCTGTASAASEELAIKIEVEKLISAYKGLEN